MVAKRNGVLTERKYTKEGQKPISFWTNPGMLELGKKPVCAAFDFIGHEGHAAGSFRSFYALITRYATQLEQMPEKFSDGRITKKISLTAMLAEVVDSFLNRNSERHHTMLITHSATAERTLFTDGCETAEILREQFDSDLELELSNVEHDARHATHAGSSSADRSTSEAEVLISKLKRSLQFIDRDTPKRNREQKWSTDLQQGSLATKHGIESCTAGGRWNGKTDEG